MHLNARIALTGAVCLAASASFAAEREEKGWGSSWTVPHSAVEKAARDAGRRMKQAMTAGDLTSMAKIAEEESRRNPDSLELARNCAIIALARHRYQDAVSGYRRALATSAARESSKLSSQLYNRMAYATGLAGDYHGARADLERAVALDPASLEAGNEYAWILATCPDRGVRDGKLALAVAQKVNHKANGNNADILDTLAAAHAETGNMREAVKIQQQALAAAPREKKPILQRHLSVFQSGQPVHEPLPAPQIDLKASH